jgi:hypothetical protein
LEAATRLEVEPAGKPTRDRRDGAQTQRLLKRPQRLHIGRGLEEEEPLGREAELGEAVAVGRAEGAEAAAREDEQRRRLGSVGRCGTAEERRQEAEGGRDVGVAPPRELVQGFKGKTSGRELAIDLGQAEGQHARAYAPLEHRQKRAQPRHDGGAAGLPIDTLNVEAHRNSS